MCLDPLTTLFGAGLLGGLLGSGKGSSPAVYQLTETPRPEAANYAMMGLFEKNLKRRRKNVKTTPLGLEDEETQKKQLTGE